MQVRHLPEDDEVAAAALAGAKQQCETKDQDDGSRPRLFTQSGASRCSGSVARLLTWAAPASFQLTAAAERRTQWAADKDL